MHLMDDVKKWRAIYKLLDHVSPQNYDCGSLCGSACCMQPDSKEEFGIYLMPGEHLLFQERDVDSGWLEWELQRDEDGGDEPLYFVKCKTPPICPRKWRPLQCRTFPLKPVIDDNGVLELIWSDDELPYSCPLIEKREPIDLDFFKATYTVWSHLIKDERIFKLVYEG